VLAAFAENALTAHLSSWFKLGFVIQLKNLFWCWALVTMFRCSQPYSSEKARLCT